MKRQANVSSFVVCRRKRRGLCAMAANYRGFFYSEGVGEVGYHEMVPLSTLHTAALFSSLNVHLHIKNTDLPGQTLQQ